MGTKWLPSVATASDTGQAHSSSHQSPSPIERSLFEVYGSLSAIAIQS